MKSGDMSKTTALTVACLSLAMYAMAQKAGGPGPGQTGQPAGMQNQPAAQSTGPTTPAPIGSPPEGSKQPQRFKGSATAPTSKTSSTPRGHHYGWQKGRHNPHKTSASPSPSASPSASMTASPSATASVSATAQPTTSPRITAPPIQSPSP